MNVGRAIVEHRLKLGLSQAEVARRADTKQSRISEIETLGGNVRFDTLDKIALALGLEVTLQPRPDVQGIPLIKSASPALDRTYTASGPILRVQPAALVTLASEV
jgi:transcriptional regulator with XRE-family HTH domain